MSDALHRDLRRLAGDAAVRAPRPDDLRDATEAMALSGAADAVVAPADADTVAAVLRYASANGVAVTPRGGGTGLAGGAVPQGGIVLALERIAGVPEIDPARWRMHALAGTTTATVRRIARESGLLFPPDPGATEQSHIGGNVATNAGGPHAFRHGVVGRWVTGIEAVTGDGELVRLGGTVRKDVAGYDLRSLLIGSEGTLAVITAVWLRLVPAPAAALPLLALYPDPQRGCDAVEAVLAAGLEPSLLEYADARTLQAAPLAAAPDGGFAVIAEAEGDADGASRLLGELREALAPGALLLHEPGDHDAFWRWRAGLTYAAIAQRGGKVSEDVAVPVERLRDVVLGTLEIGERHGLDACSWGHAGDGNVHATFLVDRADAGELARAQAAAGDVVRLALRLGGTASGEHGTGLVKRDLVAAATPERVRALQRAVKAAFDPAGILNPGKKAV